MSGRLARYAIASLFRVTWGFALAVIVGIPIVLVLGWFSRGGRRERPGHRGLSSTGATTIRNWGLGSVGDVPVPGDYDGDGKTDFAVFRQPTGQWFIIQSSTGTTNNPVFGVSGR